MASARSNTIIKGTNDLSQQFGRQHRPVTEADRRAHAALHPERHIEEETGLA